MNDLIMQMVTQGATQILCAVLLVLVNVIVAIIISGAIHYFGKATVQSAVNAIEQELGGGNGANKKTEVFGIVKKSFLGKLMSTEKINSLIEDSVFTMKNTIAQVLAGNQSAVVNYSAPQVTLDPIDVPNVIQNITKPQTGV